ncbi:hypothetical protein H8M03_05270 [Sphingomonas sabuli]|uniref:Peptidase C-terminal archaeal/bacterial domain-containing protein n=1 Tax=Sphingomonas sabuli TaxID=2764186 RepID=A0A7G9L533_9SPHN|nr:hypothetical protein [Sphingomonas sabuli]QNM83732.1 hypothetical protein H8M03_05270 [Sphingomonas sabuli]
MLRSALILAAATALVPAAAFAQAVVPVHFPAGQSGTEITGSINGQEYKDYRINLRAGQMLSVRMATVSGSPNFNVMEPGQAEVAIYNSSTSGETMEVRTAKSGDYTIRVYQMRASGRRGEAAAYRLSVSAGGGATATQLPSHHAHAPAHRSADALVAGTPYHAVSTVPCRTVEGGAMGSCKAGVIRRPGSATVHLDTPDGGERTILFRDGKAVSSDSAAGLTVERRGDTSVIRIGTVEVYEVPDALPFGG